MRYSANTARLVLLLNHSAPIDIVYNYPKEFTDKIIHSKEEEIARLVQDKEQLTSIINALLKDKELLMGLLMGKRS